MWTSSFTSWAHPMKMRYSVRVICDMSDMFLQVAIHGGLMFHVMTDFNPFAPRVNYGDM